MADKKQVKAYITKDGQTVSQGVLKEYEVDQQSESKQLPEDPFAEQYAGKKLKKPPKNLSIFSMLPEINTWQYRACDTKAMDTVGHGYKLKKRDDVENPDESQKDIFEEFKENCEQEDETLVELFYNFMWNYEVVGNGVFEIIRGLDDQILRMKEMPGHTMRRRKQEAVQVSNSNRTVSGMKIYAQKRSNKIRWFKKVGANFDLHYKTGEVYELGTLDVNKRANEVLHIQNPTSRSDYYGLPDATSALVAILGDRQSQKYNVSFFENHGVPAYAVTVTGADLNPETKSLIHKYFEEEVKKDRHGTLVITAEKEIDGGDPIDIKFEKLGVDVRDASFRLYRQDNRDEILAANGVPIYRAAVAMSGSLGQNVAREMDQIYKENVIDFRQEVLEARIARHILIPLGITDYILKFNEIDTQDQEREDERNNSYFRDGAITPNELRQAYGKEPIDGDDRMDSFYIDGQLYAGPAYEERQQPNAGDGTDNNPAMKAVVKEVGRMRQDLIAALKSGD